MDATCPVCDTVVVRNALPPPHDIDVGGTTARILEELRGGRLRYVRGDVPVEDMIALAESELRYTIVSYLACERCGRTRFWGLCVRGAPIYREVDADAPSRWRWEPVPPRERWAAGP